MKTVYIAGAVTGLNNISVSKKFQLKEQELTAQGHIVFNPVRFIEMNKLQHLEWADIMRECITHLMQCDELHLLPCWQISKGATLERDIAHRLGMPIIIH